jgi:hypothetical protein
VLRAAKLVGGVIGGSVIAFTLMACYGRPPCKDGTQDCHYPPSDEASTPSTVAPKTSAPPTTSSPTTGSSAK